MIKKLFHSKITKQITVAFIIMLICLLIGVLGYHYIAEINWIDSLHNASMILSGMGPVAEVKNFWGKIFSSIYALFSGVAFITNIGFLLAPTVHKILHKTHIEYEDLDNA